MGTGISARRAPWALVWGALIVLGWALLSSLLGGGTAHAADSPADTPSGPLSKVTDQVQATTTAVSDLVDDAVQPVAETVTEALDATETVKQPVEKTVALIPAPVRAPVSDAVATTGEVVSMTIEPVVAVVRDSPVAGVLKPVTDAVAGLPVVGDVLDSVGVPELIDRTVDAVDDVLGIADPVLTGVLPPVVDPVTPASGDAVPTTIINAPVRAATADAVSNRLFSGLSAARWSISLAPDAAVSTATVTAQVESPASAPPGVPDDPASPTTSAGPAGSSAGVPASAHASMGIHLDPWTTTRASSNSLLPSSPAGSTDVSPD